jgi:hypothetical protein
MTAGIFIRQDRFSEKALLQMRSPLACNIWTPVVESRLSSKFFVCLHLSIPIIFAPIPRAVDEILLPIYGVKIVCGFSKIGISY